MLLMINLMIWLAFALIALIVGLIALATGSKHATRHHWHARRLDCEAADTRQIPDGVAIA
jgi:hypothetical protein